MPPDRPNFNEADFSGQAGFIDLLSPEEIAENRVERLNGQRELLAVDDGLQRIVDTLDQKGELDNTMIIFMSDHGYLWGA
ncbi:MAG: sulfatase-like hydrolase/transferase [Chloroflexota bacterium]